MTANATAIQEASNDGATRHPPSSLLLPRRRPPAPDPLDDALAPPLEDDSPPPSAASPDDEDPDDEDGIPEDEDVVPPSGVGFVPPVTVMVRVVFATPSLLLPAPLADIAATQSVMVPFVAGAVNENS